MTISRNNEGEYFANKAYEEGEVVKKIDRSFNQKAFLRPDVLRVREFVEEKEILIKYKRLLQSITDLSEPEIHHIIAGRIVRYLPKVNSKSNNETGAFRVECKDSKSCGYTRECLEQAFEKAKKDFKLS
jgi:hypothetical protein